MLENENNVQQTTEPLTENNAEMFSNLCNLQK